VRRLKSVAVVGVGLIGGSFALALRKAGAVSRIVGVDRDRQALERAAALGVIDTAADSASEAASRADLVLVAVPVRAIGPVLHDVSLGLGPDAVVTDAGSTKADIVATAAQELRAGFARSCRAPIAARGERRGRGRARHLPRRARRAHAGSHRARATALVPLLEAAART